MSSGTTALPSRSATVFKRVLQVLAIVVVFVLLGPPVGAVTLLVSIAVAHMANPDLAGLAWVGIFALLYGVPLSYLFGVFPAAAAGLLIGGWQVLVGRTTWIVAVGVGFIVGLAFLYAVGREPIDGAAKEFSFWENPAIFLLTCLVPTMLCWAIVRGWYRKRPAVSNTATSSADHVE